MCTCINRNFILCIHYSNYFSMVANGIVNIAVCSLEHCQRPDISRGTNLYYYYKHYRYQSIRTSLLQNLIVISITCNFPQKLTRDQEYAFTEILDVLRAVCHAHMLPLALVWVPFCSNSNGNVSVECGDQDIKLSLRKKDLLCIQESACYVNDMRMHYFVHACAEHPLARGQGVVGNAILSNSPFFSFDVRDYDICDYPLAHHARKFGLQAAIAIRLRSTYTGSDDYVLEYFLPPMCKGSDEQQRLLDCISETMHRVCKSLRTVSDSELMADAMVKPSKEKACGIGCSSSDISVNSEHKFRVISRIETNILSGHQKENDNKLLEHHMKRANSKVISYSQLFCSPCPFLTHQFYALSAFHSFSRKLLEV